MNKDKVGEPFHYPNTFFLLLVYDAKIILSSTIQKNTEGIAHERTC